MDGKKIGFSSEITYIYDYLLVQLVAMLKGATKLKEQSTLNHDGAKMEKIWVENQMMDRWSKLPTQNS